ncbi:MAG: alpha/beta fold hydrolase [Candidatus Promineifilaceae bacterium]
MLSLISGGEPFFMPGGRTGCLLIHGFTGTPYEMRGLGTRLAEHGYSVLGTRLAHHGTNAADMNRSRWWDWYYSALDGWHLLRGICDQVFVIGHSMGGVTALMLAANNPVAGVVAMSTPAAYRNKDRQMRISRVVWPVLPLVKKPRVDDKEESWPSYEDHPVRAVGELLTYIEAMIPMLPSVTAPALLMHAVGDPTVPVANLNFIYDKISSTTKQMVRVERGGHVMTEDIDKEKVYQKVIDFLIDTGA